jgi:uncharacterized protein YdbL (DUF1318 family)
VADLLFGKFPQLSFCDAVVIESRKDMEVDMKFLQNKFWITTGVVSLVIFACVTINIYFPAEKVESVAGEIVDEIRERKGGQTEPPEQDKTSLLRGVTLVFFCSYAWADEVTEVSNPTIRALKERMKNRYRQMKPYYKKGVLREADDGYLSVGNANGLGLKEKRNLKSLVNAENNDRKELYKEVAKALKIDTSQVNKIAEIFAKEWQKPVR